MMKKIKVHDKASLQTLTEARFQRLTIISNKTTTLFGLSQVINGQALRSQKIDMTVDPNLPPGFDQAADAEKARSYRT